MGSYLRRFLIKSALFLFFSVCSGGWGQFAFTPTPEVQLGLAYSSHPDVQVYLPSPDITPPQLVVLVNKSDAQSVAVARYYKEKYELKDEQMIEMSFNVANDVSNTQFQVINDHVKRRLLPTTEAIAISWTRPYRIVFEKNTCAIAVTAGFAFAEHLQNYCELNNNYRSTGQKIWGKIAGKPKPKVALANNPLFERDFDFPYTQAKVLPAMMLAGKDTEQAKALIDRGFESRTKSQPANLHFVISHDKLRTEKREKDFRAVLEEWPGRESDKPVLWEPKEGECDYLKNEKDIALYFIGRAEVPDIHCNTYVPGAVGDHLTSYGGYLFDKQGQTTALDWLEAGATGSYGTVIEPYAIAERFPKASVFVDNYLRGKTLIQAYWHSVKDPMVGIFVGDPLARPYGSVAEYDEQTDSITITTSSLELYRDYAVVAKEPEPFGYEWEEVKTFRADTLPQTITIEDVDFNKEYRVQPAKPRTSLLVRH